MKVFDTENDNVIDGLVVSGFMSYEEAITNLIPLIDKTEFQRKLQDKKFYEKLERDIARGCVMPPITVAFITENKFPAENILVEIQKFISTHINDALVIDGIQRLNTLARVNKAEKLIKEKKLYINYIFCNSMDKLLYRMITLNNGQRPMTPRHQVEAMMSYLNVFDNYNIVYQTEKERAIKSKINPKAFNKSDLIQAYLAFMANSPLVDNKKIIQEKMDELTVVKIISSEPTEKSDFSQVLKAISKFQSNIRIFKWFKVTNNLIGFSVGMRTSYEIILSLKPEEFEESIKTFDEAFDQFNPSKIKLGKYRCELSCEFIKNYSQIKDYDADTLLEYFSDLTNE